MTRSFLRTAVLAPVVGLVALAACSEAPQAPTRLRPTAAPLGWMTPTPQPSTVCKVGPAGTYTFTIVSGEADKTRILVSSPFTLQAGECKDVYMGQANIDHVEIAEVNLPATTALDHIVVQSKVNNCALEPVTCPQTLTGTNTAIFETYAFQPYTITFYNISTGKGCTPGYWKVDQHWDSWPAPYTPAQKIGTVFANANLYSLNNVLMSNYSLVDGLNFQGGNDAGGKAQILLRAGIAGVLNASSSFSGNYPLSVADIVSQVNSALASGNKTTMTNLATTIDG